MIPIIFLLSNLFTYTNINTDTNLDTNTFMSADTNSYTLEVTVKSLKSSDGQILLSLFNKEDGFPNDPDKAIDKQTISINNKIATITFENLPKGNYAIAIAHDTNKNYKMDYNFFRIPKEGYGFSNDAKGKMSAPSFKAASIKLDVPFKKTEINVSYMFK